MTIEQTLREGQEDYDWSRQVAVQRLAALAWLEHAEGNEPGALRSMRAAADLEDGIEKHPVVTPGPVLPARELLGELFMELDEPALALPRIRKSFEDFSESIQCDLWRRACGRTFAQSKEGGRTLFGVASAMRACRHSEA